MSSYVQSTLLDGEDIIYEAKVSWIIFIKPVLAGLFLCLIAYLWGPGGALMGFIGMTILVAGCAAAAIRRAVTEIAVTDKRVILKTGFIKRDTMEQFLEKIDSISVDQTVFERLTNAGTVTVRGSGQSFSPLRSIDHPLQFRKMVNEQVDRIKGRS